MPLIRYIEIEKVASSGIDVPKDPTAWAQFVMTKFLEAHSPLSRFEIEVKFTSDKPEAGTAIGYIAVKIPQAGHTKKLVFPVVIDRFKLKPFDVFVYAGKTFPASKERIEQALFAPNVFAKASKKYSDIYSIFGLTQPPIYGIYGNVVKTSSDLLSHALASATEENIQIVRDALRDPDVITSYMYFNKENYLTKLSSAQLVYPTIPSLEEPEVIKIAEDYVLAVSRNLAVSPLNLSRYELEKLAAQPEQMVVNNPTMTQLPDLAKPKLVDSSGTWKLLTKDGKLVDAVVVTYVVDLDGQKLDRPLAFTPNGIAFQSVMYGFQVSKDAQLPTYDLAPAQPRLRVYWWQDNEGLKCVEPLKLHKAVDSEGREIGYLAESLRPPTGTKHLVPGPETIASIVRLSDGSYAVPKWMQYIEVPSSLIALATTPDVIDPNPESVVVVKSNGTDYSIEGKPVEAVNQKVSTESLSRDEAAIILGLLGASPQLIKTALDLSMYEPVRLWPCRKIDPEPLQKLAEYPAPKPVNLIKEAASIPDSATVDAVLSLGFINKYNMPLFLDALPILEQAIQKLALLLIASRLGLAVGEEPIKRALEETEQVYQELKKLEALQ